MSEIKLNSARALIKQKKYDEAREILESLDDPIATKWLSKLDEIVPVANKTPLPSRQANKAFIDQWSKPKTIQDDLTFEPDKIYDIPENQKKTIPWLAILSLILGVVLAVMLVIQQSQIQKLNADIIDLISVVDAHDSDIVSLASDLRTVSAVANNADNYAHSHNSFSDSSLKNDIVQIANPLDRVLLLQGVSFNWNDTEYPNLHLKSGNDYGVLAQDVALVFPELVITDTASGFLTVNYDGLIPILIEAIREQQSEIEELQKVISLIE